MNRCLSEIVIKHHDHCRWLTIRYTVYVWGMQRQPACHKWMLVWRVDCVVPPMRRQSSPKPVTDRTNTWGGNDAEVWLRLWSLQLVSSSLFPTERLKTGRLEDDMERNQKDMFMGKQVNLRSARILLHKIRLLSDVQTTLLWDTRIALYKNLQN